MRPLKAGSRGFTLIEVLVTIIVSAILAVLLAQLMSGHITRSHWGLEKLDSGLALREVMEIINADYKRLLSDSGQPLFALQAAVNAGGDEGGYWGDRPYGSEIQVQSYCIDLDQTGESNDHDDCSHPEDTLLKVTISYQEQSLTALFSR